MPPARHAEAAAVVALALGCAAPPSLGLRPMAVPARARDEAFAAAQLDQGLPTLMRALSERGRDGYRALRLREAQLDGWLSPEAIARVRSMLPGMVPGPGDGRWFAWRRWRGSALVGWCARGVRVLEPGGAEGSLQRTLAVERALVVGDSAGHRWAAWLEGLVLSRDGWRFAPWVAHARSVEAPRRSHPDVDLWDCDLARAPPTSAPPRRE
jgi:hypothetical protein